MKRTSISLTALLFASLWLSSGSAQQAPPPMGAPPPPPMGAPAPPTAGRLAAGAAGEPAYSGKGTVKAFNSGPNGEVNGIILSDGTAVLFAPETGAQFRSGVREGSRVTFSGMSRQGAFNRLVVDAQTVTANGQTFTAAAVQPPAPGAPGAPGVAGPAPSPDGPPVPAPAVGRGRGGIGPGPAVAGGPAALPTGCPPPPAPPVPGR